MYRDKTLNTRIYNKKELLAWGLVLALLTAIATGDIKQVASKTITDKNVEPIDVKAGSEAPLSIDADLQQAEQADVNDTIQSISFNKDVRIKDALRFLAAKYRKNIVPSPKVDGLITVTNLYDVTFEQALNAILGYGFKYERDGNFIKVYTAEEYKKIKEDKERMIHKVFTLYYVSAAEAMKLVTPVLSGAGNIQASSPAEAGISTGDDALGAEAGGDSMAMHDVLVIYDYPENIAKAEEVIKLIDVRPKQVLVEATILSADLTEETQLGIDFSTLDGVSVDTLLNVGAGIADGISTGGFAGMVETGGLSVGITSDHIAALIRALETVTDITILANPKILALNKQVGTVFIGQKIGYRDRTTIDASGQATVGEVKFLDTGTKLSFRPYIADDDYIRMDIYPKDSSGELDDEGIPTETTAELTTNIMVKDGQTVVIGGLFRDSVTTTRSQIPLLGDLPIIGAIFRGSGDTTKRQEIIVMLTPHIITEPKQTCSHARAEDINRKRYGAKDAMQWTSRARLAEDRYANAAKHYIEGNYQAALHEVNLALKLRPTYLEALRLKEKIIDQIVPEMKAKMERNILKVIEQQDTEKWLRR